MFVYRIEDLPTPTKKLTPELTPLVLFTGFEPGQVQQYIKVKFASTQGMLRCVPFCACTLQASCLVHVCLTRNVFLQSP